MGSAHSMEVYVSFVWQYRELITSFIKRDILTRYRGSFLGILWSFLNPLFLLVMYTVVFSVILGIRFPGSTDITGYSIYLFCGLVPWIAFSETVGRAPSLILANVNLVKKTVFPLEILSLMATSTGFIHGLVGLVILIGAVIVSPGQPLHWTVLLLPVVMIPQILFTIGISWFLSSVGVFVRDLSEVMRIILTAWMFMTPIMYPLETIPARYRGYMLINPLAVIIEGYRGLILKGEFPQWDGLVWTVFLGVLVAVAGYYWFMRTKKAFADVI